MNVHPDAQPAFDLIGDLHGCVSMTSALLEKLGYRQDSTGTYRHPHRQVIFLGDFIDRGPQIRETVALVRRMVEGGAALAILGNHEINALRACHFEARYRHSRQRRVLKETLEQYARYRAEWDVTLEWFMQLPLCIEQGGLRAVHACWDERLMRPFLERCPDGCLTPMQWARASDAQSFYHDLIDRATRGPQLPLPGNHCIHAQDGAQRYAFRTSFWHAHPHTYGDIVFQPDPLPPGIGDKRLGERECSQLVYYSPEAPPLFFGHYWRSGTPALIRANMACLDYSAVKGGRLVAYRYDGEPVLQTNKLISLSACDITGR